MAISKYDLDINKQAIMKPVVILRQGDYGIDTMQVSLSVANEPMDLTGATIKFMGTTASGKQIIDDVHVKIIDAKGGVFEYVFPSEAASDIGGYRVAYFSIIQANGQSSTMDFRVQVLSGVDITASEASGYISQYGTLVTKLNSAYDSATKATNQKMASTVSSLATSAATVLDSALARVNDVDSTANSASSAASKAVSMASSVASTVTSQASYINSVASSAASNVSSVAAGVVNKLNNISVGGRNYILNSSGMGASASNTPVLSGGTGDSNSKIDLQADRIVMTNNTGSKEFFYGLTKAWTDITQTPLIAGNTYTLSVKARGTSPQIALRIGFQNMNPVAAIGFTNLDNTKWTKATFTFTIPVGTPFIYMRLNGGINNQVFGFAGNETIEFKEVMLEQSNVASDWTPAPEDVPSNDAQLVHKTGTETIAGDKTFTGKVTSSQPIDGTLSTRNATFTDFNDVAKNMVKYSGSWVIAAQSIANSPLPNYYTAKITPGFTGGTDGYIELVPFASGSSKKYIAVVGSGKLSAWKSFAFDDDVVHKIGNENIAGDKTFTGKVAVAGTLDAAQKIYTRTIGSTSDLQIIYTRVGNVVTGRYTVAKSGVFTLSNNDGYKSNSGYPVNVIAQNVNAWFTTDNRFAAPDGASQGNFMFITNDPLPSN